MGDFSENKTFVVPEDILAKSIDLSLDLYRQNIWASENLGQRNDWLVFTMEDFARNTRQKLHELCNFVTIQCPSIMVSKVIEQTNHNPHDTWPLVRWRRKDIEKINGYIRNFLTDY